MSDIHVLVLIALTITSFLTLLLCPIEVFKILRDCRERKERRQRIKEARSGGQNIN